MKKNRLISIFLSALISVSLISSICVNAETEELKITNANNYDYSRLKDKNITQAIVKHGRTQESQGCSRFVM